MLDIPQQFGQNAALTWTQSDHLDKSAILSIHWKTDDRLSSGGGEFVLGEG
jgi:hypothetical protein